MVDARQDLSLVPKSLDDVFGLDAMPQELHRNAFFVLVVVTHGEINASHSSTAQFLDDAVRSDVVSSARNVR